MNGRHSVFGVSLLALLTSCGVPQQTLTSEFTPASDSSAVYSLDDEVRIRAPNAATTVLKPDTSWIKVGSIEHGDVFRSKDQVVIVNSFNVREGHIVVSDDVIVGYFLPVENTFVEVKPVPISLQAEDD